MALSVCIEGLVSEGRIKNGMSQEAERLYNLHFNQLKHSMGMMAAASEASERAIRTLQARQTQKMRQALLQAKAQKGWLERRMGEVDAGQPFNARAAHAEIEDLDLHRQAVRNQAYGMVSGLLEKFRRNAIGEVRNRSDLNAVVDELHGKASGDVNAHEIAQAWQRTAEWLRSRFNAAGGAIAKLDGWALPQTHDARALREAGFEAWRDFVVQGGPEGAPLLNREKMIDYDTGLPLSDERLDEVLNKVWESAATEGWNKADPGTMFAGAMANGRQDHRILHFADGDAWRAYAERFGGAGTAFDAMLAHIERMSRDIAAMERMGPNPAASIKWQGDWLDKRAYTAMDQKAIDRAVGARNQLERLYGEYVGRNHAPENRTIALGFSIFKAQQTAAKMGGAFLSSAGDFGTMLTTAGFDGLPMMKMLGRYGQLMAPGSAADRELAARLGLVSHEWINMAGAQWRYSGEELTHEVSRRVAEFVLKASLLSRHTEAAQMAFGMEALSAITQERGKGYGALDQGFRRLLSRYGIDEARWDQLRASPTRQERGTTWIFPEDIAAGAGGQALADDVVRLLRGEIGYAVPEPNLATRTMINSVAPKGTLMGEIVRSVFLFKAFPLSVMLMHGRRMLEQSGGARWKYGLTMAALTTAGGALSLQLKALARGQDPQDMTKGRFMAAAALQGGGLGIFGDLLASETNRFGGGIAGTLGGPAISTAGDVIGATWGNGVKAYNGKPTSFGKDAVKLLQSNTPGMSLWYTRLGYERLMGDFIAEWSNDGYGRAYAGMERYAAEQGSGYWAPPGAVTGHGGKVRGVDWGNAIGQPANPRPQ